MTSSPMLAHRPPARPSGRRRPAPSRPAADRSGPGRSPVERGGAGHDGRLGRTVGVPDLAALHGEPLGQLRRARLAAEDQQPDPSRQSAGHSAASVGTVDTTVIRRRTSHAPSSTPVRDQRCAARAPGRRRAARPATSPRRTRRTPPTDRPAPGRRDRSARRCRNTVPRRPRTRPRSGG